jgi:hypothetical protein
VLRSCSGGSSSWSGCAEIEVSAEVNAFSKEDIDICISGESCTADGDPAGVMDPRTGALWQDT